MCVERKENRCAAEGWSCTSRGSAKAWLRGVGFVASESFSFRVWRLRLFFDITSSTCMLQHCSQPGAQPVRLQSFKQSNNKKKNNQARPSRAFKSQTSEGSMLVIGSSRTLTHMASERSSSNPSRKATVTTKVPYRRSRLASAPRTRSV